MSEDLNDVMRRMPDVDREALMRLEVKRAEWNDLFTAYTLLAGPPKIGDEE